MTENPRAASEGEGRSKSPPGTREEEGWTQLGRTGRIPWSWRPESDAWGARSQEVVGREDAGSAAAQPRPSGPVTRGACKASLSGGPGASTETVRNQRWGHVSEHVCSQLPLVTILVTTMGGTGQPPHCTEEQVRVPRRELLFPGAHGWGAVRSGLGLGSQKARTHAISRRHSEAQAPTADQVGVAPGVQAKCQAC